MVLALSFLAALTAGLVWALRPTPPDRPYLEPRDTPLALIPSAQVARVLRERVKSGQARAR
jgi:hypothetical protein